MSFGVAGQRVKGRGSEFYQICQELDKQLESKLSSSCAKVLGELAVHLKCEAPSYC